MTWALVPVKTLASAKRRLSPVLRPPERRALGLAMLQDVLGALAATPGLSGRLVVGRDTEVAEICGRYGAEFLEEPRPSRGLNRALAVGLGALASRGASRVLIVPSDVPLAVPNDFASILSQAPPAPSITLAPSIDGQGTNALLLAPPLVLRPQFGRSSAPAHLAAAQKLSISTDRIDIPGLALDIDEPQHLEAFLEQATDGETLRLLRHLGVAARSPEMLRVGG